MSAIINTGSKVKIKGTGQTGKVKDFYQHHLNFQWLHVVTNENGEDLGRFIKRELEII